MEGASKGQCTAGSKHGFEYAGRVGASLTQGVMQNGSQCGKGAPFGSGDTLGHCGIISELEKIRSEHGTFLATVLTGAGSQRRARVQLLLFVTVTAATALVTDVAATTITSAVAHMSTIGPS